MRANRPEEFRNITGKIYPTNADPSEILSRFTRPEDRSQEHASSEVVKVGDLCEENVEDASQENVSMGMAKEEVEDNEHDVMIEALNEQIERGRMREDQQALAIQTLQAKYDHLVAENEQLRAINMGVPAWWLGMSLVAGILIGPLIMLVG